MKLHIRCAPARSVGVDNVPAAGTPVKLHMVKVTRCWTVGSQLATHFSSLQHQAGCVKGLNTVEAVRLQTLSSSTHPSMSSGAGSR